MGELNDIMETMRKYFLKASGKVGLERRYITLHDYLIELLFSGDLLLNKMMPSFSAIECTKKGDVCFYDHGI